MGNLYGFLGPVGTPELVLISLSGEMQDQLDGIFDLYGDQFFDGVEEEVNFAGGYTPDAHEVLTLPLTPEMQELAEQIRQGAIGRDVYDPAARPPDELRTLAWAVEQGQNPPILLQNFTRAQALNRRTTLWFDGETFSSLQDPALLIGTKIDAVIQAGTILFKKFGVLKQMFDLTAIYREATNNDIIQFAGHARVQVDDIDELCRLANVTVRKLIYSVANSGILDQLTANEVHARADANDINIAVNNGRIVLPAERRELTTVLKFLDHSIYRSPLTDDRWMANSRRRLG